MVEAAQQQDMPSVSIGMISYNQVDFIQEAVLSALSQEYGGALDVVVSDDASTDGTAELLQTLEREHSPRLKVILNRTNLGITGNSNAALAACHGDFVCLVGGDDVLLPGKIQKQVEFMLAHPEAAISFHDAEVFESESGRTTHYYNGSEHIAEGDAAAIVLRNYVCAGTAMIDRRYLPPFGFDERIPQISDWMMWIDVLARSGKQALFMPGVYFRYRQHTQSYTSSTLKRVNYRPQAEVLALTRAKYPQLTGAVAAREAELLVLQVVHSLRRRQALDLSFLPLSWRHVPFLPRAIVLMVRDYWTARQKSRKASQSFGEPA